MFSTICPHFFVAYFTLYCGGGGKDAQNIVMKKDLHISTPPNNPNNLTKI